jgi:soluble lytic murein transglycosylase-like protein
VDKNLVSAVIVQESGGNPLAISPKGAKGLMQLMDTTAASLGVTAPFSPWANVNGGTKYLRFLLDKFGGNERLALASYNAGPAAVEKYRNVPPYRETQEYVDSVLKLRRQFASIADGGQK